MKDRPNYSLATNAAYEVLYESTTTFPVIDIFHILHSCKNIKLITYSEYAATMHLSFKNFLDIAPSEHGFTIRSSHENSNFLVVYNERKSHSTIRFTLAHELGHIRLNHFCDDDISNKEANCFARNTLCPIPIINEFNLATASDYSSCFNISELMAKASILHKDSDLYYITNYNFSRINDKVYSYFTGNSIAELYS